MIDYVFLYHASIVFLAALGGVFVFVVCLYLYERFTTPTKIEKPISRRWELKVIYRNGTVYGWSNLNRTHLTRRFLHWYFGRPQSEYFMMEYDQGKRLLKRSEIVSFTIESVVNPRTGEVAPG